VMGCDSEISRPYRYGFLRCRRAITRLGSTARAPLCSGLARRPLKAVARVRIPSGLHLQTPRFPGGLVLSQPTVIGMMSARVHNGYTTGTQQREPRGPDGRRPRRAGETQGKSPGHRLFGSPTSGGLSLQPWRTTHPRTLELWRKPGSLTS
jgi:hypothetical protein